MMTGQDVLVYTLAASTWYRCRTLAQRKDGSTWESISAAERTAWVGGLRTDLERAGLRLELRRTVEITYDKEADGYG